MMYDDLVSMAMVYLKYLISHWLLNVYTCFLTVVNMSKHTTLGVQNSREFHVDGT